MEMSIVIILSIIIITFILIKKYGTNFKSIKSKAIKKSEIINGYKKLLNESIKSSNGNKDIELQKRKELLKQFNSELSRNIFFDKDEIKQVICELARY